ncbi:hypothetical protein BGZ60DRAFT_493817 [Tricladium varicosporioides]|nr:hypothetical protein BGZ60DRAFT_493817 [Hymenoscyphus varicosporioides]
MATQSTNSIVPNVSRKVKACTACQRQKVKCHVDEGNRTCNRCKQNDQSCVFKRSLQTILDDDTRWKSGLQNDLSRLERITDGILARVGLPDIASYDNEGNLTAAAQSPLASMHDQHTNVISPRSQPKQTLHQRPSPGDYGPSPRSVISIPLEERDQTSGPVEDGVLASEPMGSLYEVTRLQKFRRRAPQDERNSTQRDEELNDFISRGVIDVAEAEELLKMFTDSLNHYLWVGLDERHATLEMVRRSSPLLAASILTAMSMHIPGRTDTHDKCYSEFLSLVSQSMFRHTHNLDDIRGLTIAAFWLSDLSWKLSGHAIRIATELELHRSFNKASLSADHHERARIWYMLYVCDHHFANAYGRPPMVHESQQIIEHEKFLESPFANTLDFRLLSQVSLFMILRRVYEDFDQKTSTLAAEEARLQAYNIELDRWRLTWEPRQCPNEFIGNFPPKGIVLYYHFSKLQLNALSVRNIPVSETSTEPIFPSTKEFINQATMSALNIINLVLDDTSIRAALVGTPIYVHTMLTFASVFLFKVVVAPPNTKWKDILILNPSRILKLIERVIETLKQSQAGERHLVQRIASGLDNMITQYEQPARQTDQQPINIRGPWGVNADLGPVIGGGQYEGEMDATGNWMNAGFLDDFGSGFGIGINQFLNTQIQF